MVEAVAGVLLGGPLRGQEGLVPVARRGGGDHGRGDRHQLPVRDLPLGGGFPDHQGVRGHLQGTGLMNDLPENAALAAAEGKPPERKWYIVHTYSGFEERVKETLRQRAEALGM